MPSKAVWSPTKAIRTFREVGMSPRDIESALHGRGFRCRLSHWSRVDKPTTPSMTSFIALIDILGLNDLDFDAVINKFFTWED